MSPVKALDRNRWFILAVLFLLVNAWGVAKLSAPGRPLGRYVITTFPDTAVDGKREISWEFSEAMVSADALGVVTGAPPVAFTPAVAGVFRWERANRVVFKPAESWHPCTRFTAVLDRGLRSLAGSRLAPPISFDFQSPALKLLGVSQREFHPDGAVVLQLAFNAPVSSSALAAALHLESPPGRPLGAHVQGDATSNTQLVETDPVPNERGVLVLDRKLTGAEGPLGLDAPVRQDLRFYNVLAVLALDPVSRSFEPGYLKVRTSGPLQTDRAAAFIEVQPKVNLSVEYHYDWRGPSYRLGGDFAPGRTYTVTFRKGLPGTQQNVLHKDITRQVCFPERPPALSFRAAGRYLSGEGSRVIPLAGVNVQDAEVTVEEVYPNNLVPFAMREAGRYRSFYGKPENGLARPVATNTVTFPVKANEEVSARIRLGDLLGDRRAGAFRIRARVPNGPSADHFVVLTDIGISVKRAPHDVLVWANSIRTLAPVADAEVRVYSEQNQEVLAGRTDADGLVRLARSPSDPEPFLVVVRKDADASYLSLAGTAVGLAGETGGRPYLAGGYEAFVYTDRGVYRPGETAHVKAVVRGPDRACPEAFPVQVRVLRPDGKEKLARVLPLSALGTVELDVPWEAYDATGRYPVLVQLPGEKTPIGRATVAVEEFVPPQMKVAFEPLQGRRATGEPISLSVLASYLFGAPAAGHPASARVEVVPEDFRPADWPGYVFRDGQKHFRTQRWNLGQKKTGARGEAAFSATINSAWRPPSALKAVFGATVLELGGRGVSAYASVPIDPYPFYVGLRRPVEGAARAGEPVDLDVAAVRPDGAPADASSLRFVLYRESWATVLSKDGGGTYYYQSEHRLTPLLTNTVALADGRGRCRFTPAESGSLVALVDDPDSGASASTAVYVGSPDQRWLAWSHEQPDRVELALDRERYHPGEEAVLTIKAPFPGKALVTVESDRVLSSRVVTLEKNTADVRLPVEAIGQPNAYCVVSLIRPVRAGEDAAAHRAVGVLRLPMDQEPARLSVALSAPETIRPKGPLETTLEVRDAAGAAVPGAELTVAAVDEGICLLTGFDTPDPFGFFCGPRALGVSLFDLYALLMPETADAVAGTASDPGGGAAAALSLHGRLNPIRARRFKPVALWRTGVRTDAEGRAVVRFDVPEFTGQLRLMAVAVDTNRFGSTEAKVKVRRPVVVQSSLPRFLAPGDRCVMPVVIFNDTGRDGAASVTVTTRGPVSVDRRPETEAARAADGEGVRVRAGSRVRLAYGVQAAAEAGVATIALAVDLNGEHYEEEIELAVRPAAAPTRVAGTGTVRPGEQARIAWPRDWLPGTTRYTLVASGLPSVGLVPGLEYLVRYPYGCVEQTTSASFPLLYLADLVNAAQPGRMGREELEPFVAAGITRLLSMQTASGGFAYWPNQTHEYPWGSLYATQFLLEAKRANYEVPGDRLDQAVDYAARLLREPSPAAGDVGSPAWRSDRCRRAYACLVLALGGRPNRGWMARLGEQLDTAGYPARLNLAAAYAASGLRRDASGLVREASPTGPEEVPRELDGNLNSPARTDAMLLSIWMDLDPENAAVPALVERLDRARRGGCWYTTQENAMALMALGKYCRWVAHNAKPFTAKATWNGSERPFDSRAGLRMTNAAPGDGPATIENDGPGTVYYAWSVDGVPLGADVAEVDDRLRVRRRLLDARGQPVGDRPIQQGEMLVVEWKIEASDLPVANLVIDDLLPAGLEIENENLKTSEFIPWAKERTNLPVRHVERRDDRLLVFTADYFGGDRTFCYAVRAVTRGRFVVPALSASCLYAPDVRSVHGRGEIVVK